MCAQSRGVESGQPPGLVNGHGGNPPGERVPLIQLEKLTKIYTEAGKSRTVLDELNREFYAGEFVCLLGKSGSGKSTLLNLISGIVRAKSEGFNPAESTADE